MLKRIELMIFLSLFMAAGCVTTKKIWTSHPVAQKAANPAYEARLEPVTKGHDFYVMFKLEITNKSDKNLEIDWNRTRYLYNGRSHGIFVFKGIDPKTVKTAIPLDIIPPGVTFSKEIAPLKLVAWAPIKDNSVKAGQVGISPGVLPAGQNGVFLVLIQDGKKIVTKMTVKITEKEVAQ